MHTKIRDAQKSVPHFAVFCLLAITSTGCTPWQLAKRTMHSELQQFPRVTEGKLSVRQYKKWARTEWKKYAAENPGETHSSDYVSGFLQGFTQFVYAGGTTDPPPMPPRKYWKLGYRNHAGSAAVQDWYNGYSHGAKTARDKEYRKRAVVPSSLILGYNRGIENRYADALSESGDAAMDADTPIPSDALEQLMNDDSSDPLFNGEQSDALFEEAPHEADPPSTESIEEIPTPATDSSTALPSKINQVSFLSPEHLEEIAAPAISTSTQNLSASLSSDLPDVSESVESKPTKQVATPDLPLAEKVSSTSISESPKTVETKTTERNDETPSSLDEFSFELSAQPPTPPWESSSDKSDMSEFMDTSMFEPLEIPGDESSKSILTTSTEIQSIVTRPTSPTLQPVAANSDVKKSDDESKLTLVGPTKPTEAATKPKQSAAWSDVSNDADDDDEPNPSDVTTSTTESQWQARD